MKFSIPKQARCDNRSIVTKGPNPRDWIVGAFPADWSIHSFHFFVNWTETPPRLGDQIWNTRLVSLSPEESPETIDPGAVLRDFLLSPFKEEYLKLRRLCSSYQQVVRTIVLPELPASRINDNTPIWLIWAGEDEELSCKATSLKALKCGIQKYSGGAVKIGSKGLAFGTSVIECALSHTDAAFPGDADAVVFDDAGVVRCLIEFKKHTLIDDIGNHLVTRYYPYPDARKYRRLEALVAHYRLRSKVPFIVFYYSTRVNVIRVQVIEELTPSKVMIRSDSGNMDIGGLTPAKVASIVSRYIQA